MHMHVNSILCAADEYNIRTGAGASVASLEQMHLVDAGAWSNPAEAARDPVQWRDAFLSRSRPCEQAAAPYLLRVKLLPSPFQSMP
jgi:hypothetical protein